MTGHTLQAVGHQVVFQATAAIFLSKGIKEGEKMSRDMEISLRKEGR